MRYYLDTNCLTGERSRACPNEPNLIERRDDALSIDLAGKQPCGGPLDRQYVVGTGVEAGFDLFIVSHPCEDLDPVGQRARERNS